MRFECLTNDAVLDYVEGRIDAAERARVDAHLSTCPTCRALVAELARDDALEPMSRWLTPGTQVGRFRITGLRGRGGMGVVYEAYDADLHRTVALKLVAIAPRGEEVERLRARLLAEARGLAKVSHPNVVAVFEAGTHDGEVYLAMELVDGLTLGDWCEVEPRATAEIIAVLSGAGRGLAAAHRAGLVHRDIKPDNVLVTPSNEAKVVDFGLVQASGARNARTEHVKASLRPLSWTTGTDFTVGTPAFMAPEQHLGRAVDPRTDQFSFCLVAYEALFGVAPFVGATDAERLTAIRNGPAEPPSGRASPRLQRVLRRGLSFEPGARFPSMEALLDEIEPPKRRARGGLVVGLVATAAFAVGVMAISSSSTAPCETPAEAMDRIWSEARATEVAAIRGDETTVHRLQETLADYRARWFTSHRQVCRATRVYARQSDEAYARRMLCLDGLRHRAEIVAQAAQSREDISVGDVLQSALRLPDPARCEVDRGSALPTAPDRRGRYVAAYAALDAADAQIGLGQLDAGLAKATSASKAALELGHPTLLARAEHTLARHALVKGDLPASERRLRAALEHAARAEHDVLLAEIWLALVENQIERGRFVAAEALISVAEVATLRAGSDPLMQSRLRYFSADVRSWELDQPAAVAALQDALQLAAAAGPAGRARLVEIRIALAINLAENTAEGARAIEVGQQAFAEASALYGPGHLATNTGRFALGVARAFRGDPEGLELLREALERDREFRGEHPAHVYVYNMWGDAFAMQGDCEGAHAKYAHALELARRYFGPRDYKVAMTWRNMAGCPVPGMYAPLREALEITREARGPDHVASLRLELDIAQQDLEAGADREAGDRLTRVEAAVRARGHDETQGRWFELSAWRAARTGACAAARRLVARADAAFDGAATAWPARRIPWTALRRCRPEVASDPGPR